MVLPRMLHLRKQYHDRINSQLLAIRDGVANLADAGSVTSCAIANELARALGGGKESGAPVGQTAGRLFALFTRDYLEEAFALLREHRPGTWRFDVEKPISTAVQYCHLAELARVTNEHPELETVLGAMADYIIKPDVVVYRFPLSDDQLGGAGNAPAVATYTPLRSTNQAAPARPLLHASISCKWTIRSDRAQNTRAEALNLIRNRKGRVPHIVAVTAEPLPTRLACLAFGTGDLDCVYHFALHELSAALESGQFADQRDLLQTLVRGGRLRDISDLPFDLAV